jgi:hypothetical protein
MRPPNLDDLWPATEEHCHSTEFSGRSAIPRMRLSDKIPFPNPHRIQPPFSRAPARTGIRRLDPYDRTEQRGAIQANSDFASAPEMAHRDSIGRLRPQEKAIGFLLLSIITTAHRPVIAPSSQMPDRLCVRCNSGDACQCEKDFDPAFLNSLGGGLPSQIACSRAVPTLSSSNQGCSTGEAVPISPTDHHLSQSGRIHQLGATSLLKLGIPIPLMTRANGYDGDSLLRELVPLQT